MGRFRCRNEVCADESGRPFEFEAELRACPQCGATSEHDVLTLVVTHFVVADKAWLREHKAFKPFVACGLDPSRAEWHGTGEAWLVTCPACRASEAYRELHRPEPKVFKPAEPESGCCG